MISAYRSELLALLMVASEAICLVFAVRGLQWMRPPLQGICATCPLFTGRQLRILCVINMLLIATFAGKMMRVCGLQSNVGNIWYATVFAAQLITFHRAGWNVARETICVVYIALVAWLAFCQILAAMPVVGPSDITHAINLLATHELSSVVASFLAFVCAQAALLSAYHALRRWYWFERYLVAIAVGQAVDSVVFFPVAFASIASAVDEIALHGFAIKVAVGVLLAPVVWYLQKV